LPSQSILPGTDNTCLAAADWTFSSATNACYKAFAGPLTQGDAYFQCDLALYTRLVDLPRLNLPFTLLTGSDYAPFDRYVYQYQNGGK
jgi:hypothetical protein